MPGASLREDKKQQNRLRHMTSAEIELKGTKEDAVVENAEIVFYDMLKLRNYGRRSLLKSTMFYYINL